MELFVPLSALAPLEAALASSAGAARVPHLVALAWHLRQRDTPRAEGLATEARSLLEAGAAAPESLRARLDAASAECAFLLSRQDDAERINQRARAAFNAAGDHAGAGDCAWLEARIAESRGLRLDELPHYDEALAAYKAAGDAERVSQARAASLLATSFGDPAALSAQVGRMRAEGMATSPAIDTHLRLIDGFIAFQRGAFLEAVPALVSAAAGGEEHGLIDQAFRAEAGLVSAHSNLGDREASCALAETVLSRARTLGWPRAIGHALANFGRQLADTGQPERAVELLLEALAVLGDQPRSRSFAIASYYLGDAYLALGRNEEALARLEFAEQCMRDLSAHPEVACLLAIEAQALSRLGRADAALERAEAALALARKTRSRLWEVEALRSLAEVHASHHLAPAAYGESATALRFLDEALGVVESIGGHHEKSELYTEIARAHEAAGDTLRALSAERAARAEELREQNRKAANRMLLARERHETERQRVEAELQRSLAAAESERARMLEAALNTLDHLRQVGQDITTRLDPAEMLKAIDRHLRAMADVSFVGVFAFDAAGGKLTRHAIENGRSLPVRDIPLADFESYAARAARERREIYVEAEAGGRPATRIPGTAVTRSLWFGPLLLNDQLLGVLTVQSPTVRAYAEREKLVFRTVCAYVAVAFANARTHGELEEKHRRLTETEAEMRKLATTDPLTELANRRHFLAAAESEIARAIRYGGTVGVVMADLDRFKSVNDAGGHGAGDALMAAVAGVLRSQQRPGDLVGRIGGEEFAFVLPGADLAACGHAAERIRAAVEALQFEYEGRQYRITMSLGCASASPSAGGSNEPAQVRLAALMREADAALYESKRLGRNRVMPSSGGDATAHARA